MKRYFLIQVSVTEQGAEAGGAAKVKIAANNLAEAERRGAAVAASFEYALKVPVFCKVVELV